MPITDSDTPAGS